MGKKGHINQIGIADNKNIAIKCTFLKIIERSVNNWPNVKVKNDAEYESNSKRDNVSSSKRSYKSLPK